MSNRDEFIGNSKKNLVLKTAGSVKVLVGDKYYNFNFRDDENEDNSNDANNSIENNNNNSNNNNILIIPAIDNYDYPGDGKIIFTIDGNIYYTSNGKYNEYLKTDINIPSQFDNSIIFNNNIPFKVNSRNIIYNLNANFLNGYSESDFVKNSNNIVFKNIVVDSIVSSDGKFYYRNGESSVNQNKNNLNFINNKVVLGEGFNIEKYYELEYSKAIPYENTIINDFLNVIDAFIDKDHSPYYYFTNLFNFDNKLDLSKVEEYDNYNQILFFKNINDLYVYKKESDLWNNEIILDGEKYSLKDIYNNLAFIENLPYMKSSFVLQVDNVDCLKIYDEFEMYISDLYNDNIKINCVVTKIDKSNKKVSITTNYESYIYKNSQKYDNVFHNDGYDYVYDVYESDYTNENLIIKDNYISYGENIIGNLSGEEIPEVGKLDGYGVLLKNNSYLINSNIYTSNINTSNIICCDILNSQFTNSDITASNIKNSFCNNIDVNNSKIINCEIINNIHFLELFEDYNIDVEMYKDYSIKSNSKKIILPDSNVNGIVINIYFIDDSIININGIDENELSNTYISYKNIPISKDIYKWIKIN